MHQPKAIVLSVAFGCLAFSSAAMTQTPPESSNPARTPSQRPSERPVKTDNASTVASVLKSLEGSWTISMRMPSDPNSNSPSAADHLMTGTSTRTWILDNSVLQEKVQFSGDMDQDADARNDDRTDNRDPARPRTPGGGPNAQQDPKDRQMQDDLMQGGFEGLGLFSRDGETNGISHVWADSKSQGMTFCMGTYDPSSKTITFASHEGTIRHDDDRSRPAVGTSGTSGSQGSTQRNDTPPSANPSTSNDPPSRREPGTAAPSTPPSTTPPTSNDAPGRRDPGTAVPDSPPSASPSTSNDPPSARNPNTPPSGKTDMTNDRSRNGQPFVTLRIISENEHIVTMTQPGSNGQVKTYEITYRRAGGANGMNQPGSGR